MKQSLKRIKRRLDRLGASEGLFDYVVDQISIRDKTIKNLHKVVDDGIIHSRVSVDVEDRELEIITKKSSASKIIIDVVTGKVTLILSHKVSETVAMELEDLAYFVMDYDFFPSTTLQGIIKYKHPKYVVELKPLENFDYSKVFEFKTSV